MKYLLVVAFILIIQNVSAQDTLYHRIPRLGHQKYVLKDDGTFVYTSLQCGFGLVSYGSYTKNPVGYTFSYDTTKCPKPSIVCKNQKPVNDDSIVLFFYDMVDSSRLPYYNSIVIGDQSFECHSDSLIIPKRTLKTNLLIVENNLPFIFDSSSTELNLYLNLTFCECGLNDIRKLKKTKHGYLNKFIVYDEIREKPWKKGKKRVVREYYQLHRKSHA